MQKKRYFWIGILTFVFMFACVSATPSASLTAVNSTLTTVYFTNVENLYGYEVDLDYSGGSGTTSIKNYNVLGTTSVATYGSSLKNNILSVYGSKVDAGATVLTNSGTFAVTNVTHNNGAVSLRYVYFVYNDGSEEYVYYNVTAATQTVTGTTGGTGGGGGGGGGGAAPASLNIADVNVAVAQESLAYVLIAGQDGSRPLTLANNGDKAVTLTIEAVGLDGLITSGLQVYLAPGEEKTFDIPIAKTMKGLITGKLVIKLGEEIYKEIPVVVNVKSDNFLFDVSVSLLEQYKIILSGRPVVAQVDLREVASTEKVDVVISYVIKDFSGKEYLQDSETFFVQGEKSFAKEFSTENLPAGKYIVGIEVTYPGAFASSSSQFEIKDDKTLFYIVLLSSIFVAIAIITFIILRTTRKKTHHLHGGKK